MCMLDSAHMCACRQLRARKLVTQLPFWSAFNRGAGQSLHQQSRQVSSVPWYNLSLQDAQPRLTHNSAPVTGLGEAGAVDDPRSLGSTSSFYYEQVAPWCPV